MLYRKVYFIFCSPWISKQSHWHYFGMLRILVLKHLWLFCLQAWSRMLYVKSKMCTGLCEFDFVVQWILRIGWPDSCQRSRTKIPSIFSFGGQWKYCTVRRLFSQFYQRKALLTRLSLCTKFEQIFESSVIYWTPNESNNSLKLSMFSLKYDWKSFG